MNKAHLSNLKLGNSFSMSTRICCSKNICILEGKVPLTNWSDREYSKKVKCACKNSCV